ncbi:MAG TPA: type II secretion system protein [Holophagaceae bacterium]|nr:type II secretion system protein [Holophagaceae bacterium]
MEISRLHPARGARSSERGFTMALLLAMAVVMVILTAKAVPLARTVVQRDQEAELIYRGEAIANALRIYKAKTGAYPADLNDLMKAKPRILRRVYKDPMTREGDWDYLYQVQPGAAGDTTGLPIVGVRSKSLKDSIRVYQNKTLIHDWIFSADANILGMPGPGKGNGGVTTDAGKDGAPSGDGPKGKK